jgi:nicotinamide riboside kinase
MTPQLICLLGAECTGKTTLAQALAAHYGGLWVPESLRAFCDQQGRTPNADEQADIMRAQFDHEERVLAKARQSGCDRVLCDTAPLMTAIYSEFYFADARLNACAHALHARYALTLLLLPDLAWVADGVHRDGQAQRDAVHARLTHALQSSHHPHIEISGSGSSRLQAAIQAIDTLMN